MRGADDERWVVGSESSETGALFIPRVGVILKTCEYTPTNGNGTSPGIKTVLQYIPIGGEASASTQIRK